MKTILVMSTIYPRFESDVAGIFLKNLYSRLGETDDYRYLIVAADSPSDNTGDRGLTPLLRIERFRYWIKRWQKLAYHDAILSNLHKSHWIKLQALPFVSSLFLKSLRLTLKYSPDLIHAHWAFPTGFFAVILGRLLRIPVLITVHGGDIYGIHNPLLRQLMAFSFRNATLVNANSPQVQEEISRLAGIEPSQVWHQPVGIDERVFYPRPRDKRQVGVDDNARLLLFVGRLSEKKGVKFLIEALPLLHQKFPNLRCLIVGDGNQRGNLVAQVNQLGLEGIVEFRGAVENNLLPIYYSNADVTVVPSISDVGGAEGLGLTILEALRCGSPVVVSESGGTVSLRHLSSLRMVPPKDVPRLAQAIGQFLDENERATNFGQTRFITLEVVARNYLDRYGELIRLHPRG